MRRERVVFLVVFAAVAAGAIALDVHLAWRAVYAPARCAEGMVLLGARCCGEGQALESSRPHPTEGSPAAGDRCVGAPTRCAAGLAPGPEGCAPEAPDARAEIAAGTLTVAPGDWEATGVVRARSEAIAAFAIDAFEVTEARWARCVDAGACARLPVRGEPGLPAAGMTAAEAEAFCRFAGGRLPTESELAFAAAGPEGRRYPWGRTGFVCRRAAWGLVAGPCAEGATGPEIVGAHPAGATPTKIHDLAGNVAEWTAPVGERAAVLGGSFEDVEAAALRTWSRRLVPVDTRSAAIGLRCAYAAGG